MKILVISQYYFPEPFRVNEICEELVRRGHRVTVITGIPNYPDGEVYSGYQNVNSREVISGVEVFRCAIRPRYQGNLNLARNYISFIKSTLKFVNGRKIDFQSYDVIYAYQLSPVTSMIPAVKIKKKYGIPLFMYCLDMWPESISEVFHQNGMIYRFVKSLSSRIYGSADRIGVTSPWFITYLEALGVDKETIAYVPQHASDFSSVLVTRTDILFEKTGDILDFLFLGNIGDSQNLDGVLRALSLAKHRDSIRLHVVGSGSSLAKAKRICAELNLEGCVTFYGRKPFSEMDQYYSLADMCIISLKKEGMIGHTVPGKLQEYMSAGKAVLAFIDGDAAKIVDESGCGVTVPAEDETKLALVFDSIFEHPAGINAWGQNAREYYETHFTLTKYIDRIEKELLIARNNKCIKPMEERKDGEKSSHSRR